MARRHMRLGLAWLGLGGSQGGGWWVVDLGGLEGSRDGGGVQGLAAGP